MRRGWWGYVKWVIRDQPEKRRELEALRNTLHGGGCINVSFSNPSESRSTERAATQELHGHAAVEYAAVEAAIADVKTLKNGLEKLKLIDMVFWRQSHTLEGAAMVCHISRRTAIRWHGDFIRLVAEKMGFVP